VRGETVRAQHDHVARRRRELGEVRIDRAPHADGAREHVAVRVSVRGVGRDLTPAHQLRDERVIVGELADPPAAHEIGAAVADVREREPSAAREHRDERRAHARDLGLALRGRKHVVVGRGDAVAQLLGQGRAAVGDQLERLHRVLDREPARELPRHVTAHPIRHQIEPERGRERVGVLVRGAPLSDVRTGGGTELHRSRTPPRGPGRRVGIRSIGGHETRLERF
jgi:hypothetical protein